MAEKKKAKVENVVAVGNGAKEIISGNLPYIVSVTIQGSSDMLFHRWNPDGVEEGSGKTLSETPGDFITNPALKPNSKKYDVVENYVFRDEKGFICLPGEYLKMSCVNAAKSKQDPRSSRKSARDLYNAGVVAFTKLAPIVASSKKSFSTSWDYLDKTRVVIKMNAVSRVRPAFVAGWQATVQMSVLAPEYISPNDLLDTLNIAGRLVGVGDHRPSYGRFNVVKYEILK